MTKSKFTADALPDLHGKVFLVTGGNNGIGKETVRELARHGARVYMGARSEKKAQDSIQDIKQTVPDADIRFLQIDLGSLASVVAAAKKFAAEESKLNGLINNAGIMGTPFEMTDDGFESQFQTNYLSHWLLTYRLLPLLQRTAAAATAAGEAPGAARVVCVSSNGHALFALKEGIRFEDTALKGEGNMTRYGQSKLANILHAKQLHALYGPKGTEPQPDAIWAVSLHPGTVRTNLADGTDMGPAVVKRAAVAMLTCVGVLVAPEKGALSSLWAAAGADYPGQTAGGGAGAGAGGYVVPYAQLGEPSAAARDPALAAKLWTWTEETLRAKGVLDDAA